MIGHIGEYELRRLLVHDTSRSGAARDRLRPSPLKALAFAIWTSSPSSLPALEQWCETRRLDHIGIRM